MHAGLVARLLEGLMEINGHKSALFKPQCMDQIHQSTDDTNRDARSLLLIGLMQLAKMHGPVKECEECKDKPITQSIDTYASTPQVSKIGH